MYQRITLTGGFTRRVSRWMGGRKGRAGCISLRCLGRGGCLVVDLYHVSCTNTQLTCVNRPGLGCIMDDEMYYRLRHLTQIKRTVPLRSNPKTRSSISASDFVFVFAFAFTTIDYVHHSHPHICIPQPSLCTHPQSRFHTPNSQIPFCVPYVQKSRCL